MKRATWIVIANDRVLLSTLFLCMTGPASPAQESNVDLSRSYPATLDFSDPPAGRTWECSPQDVWSLRSFSVNVGADFKLDTGPAQVVFGVHAGNVVWARLEPREPGRITTSQPGGGEEVRSVWLRFNPALVGTLFPAATVEGRGDERQTILARREAAWKMGGSWQSGNLPVIPWRKSIIVDVDMVNGKRRFYSLDTEAGVVKYEPFFETKALPPTKPVNEDDALRAFDAVWSAYDREYAMFVIKPDVDWTAQRDRCRPRAAQARTTYDVAAVIADMLATLKDLHIWVKCGEEGLPVYNRPRPGNGNPAAAEKLFGKPIDSKKGVAWARSADGVVYLNIYALNDEKLPDAVDNILESVRGSAGMIIDLRYNGGGGEDLGLRIAGRFLDKPAIYSRNQYRNGPNHGDLGPMHDRVARPRGPWRWEAPVVVLIGERTMSSAESFALMLAQVPNAITMGRRTAGSSANPRRLDAGLDITVNLPRWIDYLPDGTPLEKTGIVPKVPIETTAADFTGDRDPVLEAALQRLRTTTQP